MSKIKKGDNVVVIAGRDKGKRGDVSRIVDARHVVVNGVNTVKKHTKPNPMKNQPGGIITKEMPIDVSQRRDLQPGDQEGGPHRHAHARGRPQGPLLQGQRRADRLGTDRKADGPLEGTVQEGNRAGADEAVRLQVADAGAAHHQDHAQHGRGRGDRRQEDPRQRRGRHAEGVGPEAGGHQGAQGHRRLQDPRGLSDRLHGDAAPGADVRVPRPLRDHRAAARARLPRHLRRARSTAAATTTSASRNRSSSRRSSTTRSTRSAG